MFNLAVFAALVLALAIGYGLGRRPPFAANSQWRRFNMPWSRKRYYQGLTYLLNDQSDEAIDALIGAMDVNGDTLETHLAFAGMLRRRGDVRRSVRVHENLLGHTSLSADQRHLVQLELAVDYHASGLLDRAEALLKEFVGASQVSTDTRRRALRHLIEVYQDLGEWLLAIDVADQLTEKKFAREADHWKRLQAHYACELAEKCRAQADQEALNKWMRHALEYDPDCARAQLLRAQIELDNGEYALAAATLLAVLTRNPGLSPHLLPLLYSTYQHKQKLAELHDKLTARYQAHPSLPVLAYLARLTRNGSGEQAEQALLLRELPRFQHTPAHAQLFHWLAASAESLTPQQAAALTSALEQLASVPQPYRCANCGFSGEQMHWCCPSCKQWGQIGMALNGA